VRTVLDNASRQCDFTPFRSFETLLSQQNAPVDSRENADKTQHQQLGGNEVHAKVGKRVAVKSNEARERRGRERPEGITYKPPDEERYGDQRRPKRCQFLRDEQIMDGRDVNTQKKKIPNVSLGRFSKRPLIASTFFLVCSRRNFLLMIIRDIFAKVNQPSVAAIAPAKENLQPI